MNSKQDHLLEAGVDSFAPNVMNVRKDLWGFVVSCQKTEYLSCPRHLL